MRLILALRRVWFDLIKSGQKTEEYRMIRPYWVNRFIDERYCHSFKTIAYDNDDDYSKAVYDLVMQYTRQGINVFKQFDELIFTKGYPHKEDTERRMHKQKPEICISYGIESLGATKNRLYFVITWTIEHN